MDTDLLRAQLKDTNKRKLPRRSQKVRPFLRPMRACVYTRSHTSLTRIIDQHTLSNPSQCHSTVPAAPILKSNLKTKSPASLPSNILNGPFAPPSRKKPYITPPNPNSSLPPQLLPESAPRYTPAHPRPSATIADRHPAAPSQKATKSS